ncbi:MAG TPA: hypothetical protein VED46_00190 [Alphaproteobacteria bacterium]|nr:hypothetical protein [Alphaproteobacteria bacterium]
MPRGRSLRKDERGIALVMVIWVLALLSLMAASLLAEARVELRRAVNLRERAVAEALAEAGIHIAIARLLGERGGLYPQRWSETLASGSVTLTLMDERGKIDLNEAEPALLAGLFESKGLPSRATKALAAAIVDFRDPDRTPAIDGAEDPDYPPGSGGAKDSRFETIDELLQVKGMTPVLYAEIMPLVTVDSFLPGIDPLLAEIEVLEAVPNIDRAELERFLTLRRKLAPILNVPAVPENAGGNSANRRRANAYSQLQSAVPRRNSVERYFLFEGVTQTAFGISAEAVTLAGARYRRDTVVRVTEDESAPFEILEWRRPQSAN